MSTTFERQKFWEFHHYGLKQPNSFVKVITIGFVELSLYFDMKLYCLMKQALHNNLCINHFLGGKEYLMKAQFFLPSVDGNLAEGKPPINVKFEIPYFTTSGIQVNHIN